MDYIHKKYYIGNISANKFYYKDAIFAYYNMVLLTQFLPIELVDYILSYICSSLVVFAAKNTIYYINPRDNAIIKTIKLNKIKGLTVHNNIFSISEDGLTFYRIYRRHLELEYLCDEVPDPNKPPRKQTIDTNRYYHSYNITKKCTVSVPVLKYSPDATSFGNKISLSSNGKYIASYVSGCHVINQSSSYIAIYEAKTKAFVCEISIQADRICGVSISPDNTKIMAVVAGLEDEKQSVLVWDIITGNPILQQSCSTDMYFPTFFPMETKAIVWNPSSTKVIVIFRKDNIELPHDEYIETTSVVYHDFIQNTTSFKTCPCAINHFTWINDDTVAYYTSNVIYTGVWSSGTFNGIHFSDVSMHSLRASLEGQLVIRYFDQNTYTNQSIIMT